MNEFTIPALPDFEGAAPHVGARNGKALKMRFHRGDYPQEFLVQDGARRVLVDLPGLVAYIKANRPRGSRKTPAPAEGTQA